MLYPNRNDDILKLRREVALPDDYDTYVFDLYGTLVDIHTEEDDPEVWEKLALFFGYYGASYDPKELMEAYELLVGEKESALKETDEMVHCAHESSPEIEITEVFFDLYAKKGVAADEALCVHTGQFFRALSTKYVRAYPGAEAMLKELCDRGKKVYLLSNAQRIFTLHEMRMLGIEMYFDGIFISSDHRVKKPDRRFFDALISRYGIDVSRALFIGNDSRADVSGAKAAGFPVFYVNSNLSPEGDTAPEADFFVDSFGGWSESLDTKTKFA